MNRRQFIASAAGFSLAIPVISQAKPATLDFMDVSVNDLGVFERFVLPEGWTITQFTSDGEVVKIKAGGKGASHE